MNEIELIRRELAENLGKKVIIKANRGRKKYVTKRGVLKAAYSSLFLIDTFIGDELKTLTFTYSDVITRTVKLIILEDDVSYSDINKNIKIG